MAVISAAAMAAGCGGGGGGIVLWSRGSGWRSLPNLGPNLSKPDSVFPVKPHVSIYRIRSLGVVPRAAESTQPSSVASGNAGKSTVPDDEFSLAKVSFGVIGLGLGVSLLSYGFGAYFNILPGSEWSAIMLTYGFPLAIIGMALKYAELKPVPCLTYSDAQALRDKCATPILNQVRSDVTRYRYGDEQHLEEALKRIFQYGMGGGIPRRSAPILQSIREEVTEDGRYALVLIFEAKALELSDFEQRKAKFASFFGPGITAEIAEAGKDLYEIKLISNTTL
ncbi:acclimation of photosynthesis to environment [Perilla frutescens var. frutescens]|nr:acclimation of photosynthesis to environment [Perilla frutescens var. frutescens]